MWAPPPNGSRLSCGRPARRRKSSGRTSALRQGHNTPFPLRRSPPVSFKRLLGCPVIDSDHQGGARRTMASVPPAHSAPKTALPATVIRIGVQSSVAKDQERVNPSRSVMTIGTVMQPSAPHREVRISDSASRLRPRSVRVSRIAKTPPLKPPHAVKRIGKNTNGGGTTSERGPELPSTPIAIPSGSHRNAHTTAIIRTARTLRIQAMVRNSWGQPN